MKCPAESEGYTCDRDTLSWHQLHHDPDGEANTCTWWLLQVDYTKAEEREGRVRPSGYALVSDPILSDHCLHCEHKRR